VKKFYAINLYEGEVWVERGYYTDENEAEADLVRNNPQVILTQEEMRNIIKSVIGDFLEERP